MLVLLTDMMILHCWSFVAFLFHQLVVRFMKHWIENNKGNIESFSDDILINMLSRLPVESVLQCQRVCKRWRNITLTSHFIELHYKTSQPLIFVRFCDDLCEFNPNKATAKLTLSPVGRYLTQYHKNILFNIMSTSCRGLILYRVTVPDLRPPRRFIFSICNPFTRENFTLPRLGTGWHVCGFFYHPLSMEHRILYFYTQDHYGYKIFSVETKSCRDLILMAFMPDGTDPINVNGSLYWKTYTRYFRTRLDSCANLILKFDVNSEVFDTIQHPGYLSCSGGHHHIVEIGGELCYYKIEKMQPVIIWMLVDSTRKDWLKRYEINLFDSLEYYHSELRFVDCDVSIMGLYNDELVFHWINWGLFSYNLQKVTLRKIEFEKNLGKYTGGIGAFVYKKSLVSLKHSLQVEREASRRVYTIT